MIPNPNEKEVPTSTDEAPKQESIFADYDVTDMTGYDKNLKTARIYLYIVAALQFGVGLFQFFSMKEDFGMEYALLNGGIIAGIGLIFLILAIWSYKKPAAAFLTALIFFIVVHVSDAIVEPTQLIKGILLKILVLVALIKGYKDAREYEQMKKTLGIEPQ